MALTAPPPASSLEARDRRTVLHPFTRLDDYAAGRTPRQFIVVGADGMRVRDQTGRVVLDAFSGLYCVNVGYGREEIVAAMAQQAHDMPYFHIFAGASHTPAIDLADKLLDLAGPRYKRVFFGTSGSDANETQVKLVWYANNVRGLPAKKKIVARRRGYHGGTIVTASLTGLPVYHQGFDLVSDVIRHTTAPDPFWAEDTDPARFAERCAKDLEDLILTEGPETVGAFIAEPMIGAGGIVPPPPGYWAAIQAVLRKYDVFLIADEVVTGFGRVGEMFACPAWGIEPDLVTLAKGLTSGYAPLSAVLVGERIWDALETGARTHGIFGHGYTYTAHPLGAAAALANIAIMEREGLCANARVVGGYLQDLLKLRFANHPLVGEIRGEGALMAVEFVAEDAPRRRLPLDIRFAARVTALAAEEGVLVRTMPFGDIVGLAPALILTRADAEEITDKLGRAVDRATAELTSDQRKARV